MHPVVTLFDVDNTLLDNDRAKADLEASTILAQQRQSTETDAEQQMRTEQDKLDMLESRLDELVGKIGSPSAQPARVPR